MTILDRDIKQRSELINNIAYHMYSASHRIPPNTETTLNEVMTILLIENEKCRKYMKGG